MGKLVDLTGKQFGRLTVLELSERRSPAGRYMWVCGCTCGVSVHVQGNNLQSGNTNSCGCANREASAARMVGVGRMANRAKPDDEIGYTAAHDRVRRVYGSATARACVDCSSRADGWSLKRDAGAARPAAAGKGAGLMISPDPSDYEPRCGKCHCAYDNYARGLGRKAAKGAA